MRVNFEAGDGDGDVDSTVGEVLVESIGVLDGRAMKLGVIIDLRNNTPFIMRRVTS